MKKAICCLALAVIIAVAAFSVYQSNTRADINRLNQALIHSLAPENAFGDMNRLVASLPDNVHQTIIEVVSDHNVFDTHTGTWLVTGQDFATKQGILLWSELIPEISKAQNLGFAIELLGNINGVYSYHLQYYWD